MKDSSKMRCKFRGEQLWCLVQKCHVCVKSPASFLFLTGPPSVKIFTFYDGFSKDLGPFCHVFAGSSKKRKFCLKFNHRLPEKSPEIQLSTFPTYTFAAPRVPRAWVHYTINKRAVPRRRKGSWRSAARGNCGGMDGRQRPVSRAVCFA